MCSTAPIYKFFGPAVFVPPDLNSKNQSVRYKYKCMFCAEKNILTPTNETVYVLSYGSTTSNLIVHLNASSHAAVKEEYLELVKSKLSGTPAHAQKKLKFDNGTSSPSTPKSTLKEINFFASSPKYMNKSVIQKSR